MKSHRSGISIQGLLFPVLLVLANSLVSAVANPPTFSADLARAIVQSGAPSIAAAHPNQFVRAVGSVFVTKKPRDLPSCVTAAVHLRLDLADKTVGTAINNCRLNLSLGKSQPCPYAGPIVTAAVLANPDAAAAIVRAALLADPAARDMIAAAALRAAPIQRLAILNVAGETQTITFLQPVVFGSLNPLNYAGAEPVMWPEQPPAH